VRLTTPRFSGRELSTAITILSARYRPLGSCSRAAGWSAATLCFGTKQTCRSPRRMSVVGGTADMFWKCRHFRFRPRPCGNVFRLPRTARNRARWASTRPSELIFAVSSLESTRAQPGGRAERDERSQSAYNMTRSSCPDRREERFDTDDVHHAREVVGEHVQRHLRRHFGQRLHQKVRRPHPHLQRAKRMLDRLATSTHCIRISVQARLNSIDNILVLPPLDATLRSLRALSLQRAGAARVGPIVVQDQSIFLVREVVS